MIDDATLVAKVTAIVREIECIPTERKLTPQTHFKNDLGTDSLFDAEFAMTLEEQFEISISNELVPPQTIEETVELLKGELQKAGKV